MQAVYRPACENRKRTLLDHVIDWIVLWYGTGSNPQTEVMAQVGIFDF